MDFARVEKAQRQTCSYENLDLKSKFMFIIPVFSSFLPMLIEAYFETWMKL